MSSGESLIRREISVSEGITGGAGSHGVLPELIFACSRTMKLSENIKITTTKMMMVNLTLLLPLVAEPWVTVEEESLPNGELELVTNMLIDPLLLLLYSLLETHFKRPKHNHR